MEPSEQTQVMNSQGVSWQQLRLMRLLAAIAAALMLSGAAAVLAPVAVAAEDTDLADIALNRYGGADRYATSLQIAEAFAADAGGRLDSVVLVSGLSWHDAVVAGSLAGLLDAPVLLTPPTELRADALDFLLQVGIADAVLVSTGTDAQSRSISPSVMSALESAGIEVEWVGGADRYETGVAVADRAGVAGVLGGFGSTAIIASGEAFADALVAGSLSARGGHPVLLNPQTELDSSVEAYLSGSGIRHVVLMGGTAALSSAVEEAIRGMGIAVSRIAGANRYDTAVKAARFVAEHSDASCFSGSEVGMARARVPFDSLSAGPLLARRCAPLVLADPASIPPETAAFLDSARRAGGVADLHLAVFGGEAAIAQSAIDSYMSTTSTTAPKAVQPTVLPAGSCGGSSTDPPVRIGRPSSWVHDPTWSPDCRYIAYVQDGALWRADTDGSSKVALFEVPHFGPSFRDSFRPHYASWSPQGDLIAFVVIDETVQPRVGHLHVIGADGTGLRQLSHGELIDRSTTWSPDGGSIAVVRETGASVNESGRHSWGVFALVVIDVDTGAAETRVPPGEFDSHHIRWSPDGTKFAFKKRSDLWIMNADGSNAKFLFDPNPEHGATAVHAMSWSPDGRQIAYIGGPGLGKSKIHLVNVDGSGHRTLEGVSGILFDPAWSPDGDRIAYVDSQFRRLSESSFAIWALQLRIVGVDAPG